MSKPHLMDKPMRHLDSRYRPRVRFRDYGFSLRGCLDTFLNPTLNDRNGQGCACKLQQLRARFFSLRAKKLRGLALGFLLLGEVLLIRLPSDPPPLLVRQVESASLRFLGLSTILHTCLPIFSLSCVSTSDASGSRKVQVSGLQDVVVLPEPVGACHFPSQAGDEVGNQAYVPQELVNCN